MCKDRNLNSLLKVRFSTLLRSVFRDVKECDGGHTVTLGKYDLEIGFVSIVVETGFALQELNKLSIKKIEVTKLRATMIIQKNLLRWDLDEEMYVRPWIVEDSRKSLSPSILCKKIPRQD